MAFLTVDNVRRIGSGEFALNNISFTQLENEKIVIAGETGSGKTTLLKVIGGLLQPDSGNLRFLDRKIIGPYDQLIPGHPGIAYLSQHFELRNNYFVHEILEYANKMPAGEAEILYKLCRINQLMKRRTDQLSGGEKQRIALAKLLTGSPKLLLLDEPFSNLDVIHRNIIKEVLNDVCTQLNISCIMISHDAPGILSWANTILVIKDGKLIQKGGPEEIYNRPISSYAAGLFGAYNLIEQQLAELLCEQLHIAINRKQMLLRPEHLAIAATGNDALKGTVTDIIFWGNYYTVEVIVHQQRVMVASIDPVAMVGDSVYLIAKPGKMWWV